METNKKTLLVQLDINELKDIIKLSGYFKIISDFRKRYKYAYIQDLTLLKAISYYYLRSRTIETDSEWLTLITDIKEDLKQIDSKTKSAFLQKLKKDKQLKIAF